MGNYLSGGVYLQLLERYLDLRLFGWFYYRSVFMNGGQKKRDACTHGSWQKLPPQATKRAGESVIASHLRGL